MLGIVFFFWWVNRADTKGVRLGGLFDRERAGTGAPRGRSKQVEEVAAPFALLASLHLRSCWGSGPSQRGVAAVSGALTSLHLLQ